MFKTLPIKLSYLCMLSMGMVLISPAQVAIAQASPTAPAAADIARPVPASRIHEVSLLKGKLAFTLTGYVKQADPKRADVTRYFGPADKRFVGTSERSLAKMGAGGKAVDLKQAAEIIKQEQKSEYPDYRARSETQGKYKGLDMIRIDAFDNANGYNVINTNLLIQDRGQLAVVQVISANRQKLEHEAWVQKILGK
ncbi:hypothetical protein FXN63_01530 [Pigmentiphaga aceris]|uniref:Uncharacterized protein n=1 Tax=Pigmentiphaga aceris TaxID=1940612 RepID=A0A5C0ARR3_9BURK|nr:hypothetical protein [Pigmentiphaga aceris]QEI04665.1 hypothetical protein FXN63_01530 [Pigmentiphaga aceris]